MLNYVFLMIELLKWKVYLVGKAIHVRVSSQDIGTLRILKRKRCVVARLKNACRQGCSNIEKKKNNKGIKTKGKKTKESEAYRMRHRFLVLACKGSKV